MEKIDFSKLKDWKSVIIILLLMLNGILASQGLSTPLTEQAIIDIATSIIDAEIEIQLRAFLEQEINSRFYRLQNPGCDAWITQVGSQYVLANGTSAKVIDYDTNLTLVQEWAIGNVNTGIIFLDELEWNTALTVPANAGVIQIYQGNVDYYGLTLTTDGNLDASEFYRDGYNYTALIETLIAASNSSIAYDWDYYMYLEGSYYVSYDPSDGSVVANSTDAKVTYNSTRELVTQFGGIKCGPGTFVSSGEIYLQAEGGGVIPDFDNGIIFSGTGRPGASGMDENATRWQFPAGSDGFIVDMHTNSGQWYTETTLANMAIHGTSGNEMATCIKAVKTTNFKAHNIYTYYAGAGNTSHVNITNGQDWELTHIRTNLNLNYSIGFLIQNIEGSGKGYTEQGAHGLAENLKSGIPNGAYAGMINYWLTVPSGTAVISQITWENCESMISDDSGTGTGHTGWKYGNGADTAGIRTQTHTGGNYEGGNYTEGDRAIYADVNGKVCRVDITSGGFASGAGIEFDDTQTHMTLRNCEPEPATVDTGSSSISMENTDEPTTLIGNFESPIASYIVHAGMANIPNGAADVWVEHGCATEPDAIIVFGAINNAEAADLVCAFSATNSTHFRVYYKGGGNVGQTTHFYFLAYVMQILASLIRHFMMLTGG